jgi:hypothetical protein
VVIDNKAIKYMKGNLPRKSLDRIKKAAQWIVEAKEKGKKVVAVIGSGPNLHEGVTTLVAELIHKGIIDGVTTSSAVINHEMAGTLEKVKRINGSGLGIDKLKLPADGIFEVSIIPWSLVYKYESVPGIDMGLYKKMRRARGDIIIKVAGNIAYPTGLYTEIISRDILSVSKKRNVPFETTAGIGADPMTMIGAGALNNIPVLVTVPQLVGGGEVGLAIGDSLPISERSYRIAELLDKADVIVESAVALTQEVHDGPFELYTGHGIWKNWEGGWSYSLANKKIVRIDMDPNLERAWIQERRSKSVSRAVDKGLPKTKNLKIPFRMEMSGFARIPGSLPVVTDIGIFWPIVANIVADSLGIQLDFMCYKQSMAAGKRVREWIAENVKSVDMNLILKHKYPK